MRAAGARPELSVAIYRDCLYRHFGDREPREVEFFINERRFDILRDALGQHLEGADILNVACGPFALEFYVAPEAASVDSFDVDEALSPLHEELSARGLVQRSTFRTADVMAYEPLRSYDVIIINDLFYTKYVDFYPIVEKYVRHLKPGGRLYFDILDERAGPIWAAFGKDERYRRYDLEDVSRTLSAHGLSVEARIPSIGIKGGLDGMMRRLMWGASSIANNFIFIGRRLAWMVAVPLGFPELLP